MTPSNEQIGAPPLAGLQLMRLDQGAAAASAPARQPGERTFGVVDGNLAAAELGDDRAPRYGEMAAAKAVDLGLRQVGQARRFARLAAACKASSGTSKTVVGDFQARSAGLPTAGCGRRQGWSKPSSSVMGRYSL
jgi:hypothetical protein